MSGRRQYPFHLIEPKWQKVWDEQQAFRAFNPNDSVPEGHPFGIRHGLSGKVAAGQLPKFYDNLYHDVEDDLWLVPTAEVPISTSLRAIISGATRPPRTSSAET